MTSLRAWCDARAARGEARAPRLLPVVSKGLAAALLLLCLPIQAHAQDAGLPSCPAGHRVHCTPRTVMVRETRTRLNCDASLTRCQNSLLTRASPVTDQYCSCRREGDR